MGILTRTSAPKRDWPGTRWSAVECLEDRADPLWGESWTWLVENYLPSMEGYVLAVLRSRSHPEANPGKAEEIVAMFVADCVEKSLLRTATKERGSFRVFVQTVLWRYTISVMRHETAKRRHPGAGRFVYEIREEDAQTHDAAAQAEAAEALNRAWVNVVRERALRLLREESPRLHTVAIDLLATDGVGSPEIAKQLEVRKPYMAVLRHRAKARFEHHFKEELAATVSGPSEFEAEWARLALHLP